MASTTTGWASQDTHGTTSPVTGSAPSGATDGQPIQDLDGVTVVIECPSGQTLSGAGSLLCYIWADGLQAWVRLPQADISVSTSGTQRCAFTPSLVTAPTRNGRLKFVPSGVTFGGGSTGLVVYQYGSGAKVQRRFS